MRKTQLQNTQLWRTALTKTGLRVLALGSTLALGTFAAGIADAAVNVQAQPGGAFFEGIGSTGDSSRRYDLVIVGDGFTAAEQGEFNARVDDVVEALLAREPYASHMCAFNIWRVNVVSAESGVDHPNRGEVKDTELDVRYGDPARNEAVRCIRSDSPAKVLEAAGYAPEYDAVFVLANDDDWGGCAGQIVYSSTAPGFAGIVTHELGHKIGSLADEYTCYLCDGSDSGQSYGGSEPGAANCTAQTTRADIKWKDLIAAGTPLPTVGGPPGQVGIYAGCQYKALDIYSPEETCHMRDSGRDFCAVCDREMVEALRSHCSSCDLALSPILQTLACLDLRLPETRPPWWEIIGLRWPIPVCLSCPTNDILDRFEIVVRGLPFEETIVRIVDDGGRVLSTGQVGDNETRANFTALRGAGYWLEVEYPQAIQLESFPRVEILQDGKAVAFDGPPQAMSPGDGSAE